MPGGTGVKAAIPGYRVAGKTGTAQQPDPNHGGAYSSWMNWDTFAGMVPADNPQFVVAIMVDNPAHGLEGGDVAAPLFHEIASYELMHAQIPPTGSLSSTCRCRCATRSPGWPRPVPSADVPAGVAAEPAGCRGRPRSRRCRCASLVAAPVPAPGCDRRRRRGHRRHHGQRPRPARATCSRRSRARAPTARVRRSRASPPARSRCSPTPAGVAAVPAGVPALVVADVRAAARPGRRRASTAIRAASSTSSA